MSDNALAIRQTLTPDVWRMINDIAPVMAESRLFGVPSPAAAAAIMLKGLELGLSLTASFEFIHVIEGKPALSPRGCLALIQQNENFAGLEIKDITDANGNPYACRVTMKRKNGFSYTGEFNMNDAKRAGLVRAGGGWEKYPANMLRWRTIGYVADVVFPDVSGGMKRADEMGAPITPEGDAIKDYVIEAEPMPALPAEVIPDYKMSLPELMEKFSDDEILAANGGAYPMTPEQINKTVHVILQAREVAQNDEAQEEN